MYDTANVEMMYGLGEFFASYQFGFLVTQSKSADVSISSHYK